MSGHNVSCNQQKAIMTQSTNSHNTLKRTILCIPWTIANFSAISKGVIAIKSANSWKQSSQKVILINTTKSQRWSWHVCKLTRHEHSKLLLVIMAFRKHTSQGASMKDYISYRSNHKNKADCCDNDSQSKRMSTVMLLAINSV